MGREMSRIEDERHIRSLFRQFGLDIPAQLRLVARLRDIAIEYLQPVIAKVPPPYFSDEIRAVCKAKGISLEWNLTTDGDTGATGDYAFFFAARDAGLTPSQQSAAALLYATLEALEENAVSDRVRQNILDAIAGLDLDAVSIGEKFTTPPPRSTDTLGDVLLEILERIGKSASAKDVWKELQKMADSHWYDAVIQEVDDEKVYWRKGHTEKQTKFRSIANRLIKIRKKI